MTTDTPTTPRPREPNFGLMSFGDHLEDLRKRIFLGIIGVLPIFLIAFGFGRELLSMLIEPARTELLKGGQSATMLQTAPFETFGTVVHISVVVTVLLGAPWLLYQLWRFIAPGLYSHERRFVHFLAPLSMVLAVSGILFLFHIILPLVLAFFVGWGNNVSQPDPETMIVPPGIVLQEVTVLEADPVEPTAGQAWLNSTLSQWRVCVENLPEQPPKIMGVGLTTGSSIVQQYKISEYVKTVLNMGMAFGIGFQMPVVVLMCGWIGIVGLDGFKKYRKHIFAGCFVAAAILTPADPASMLLLGTPLYLLFELGLILLKFFPASKVAGHREVMTHDDGP
ncbi:MAG: sec-independent protein translocase protein TatC [Phycisphaerales bacterium]|jgi:sec-independent protein translocase protein TatC